jgi:hypothetical protein
MKILITRSSDAFSTVRKEAIEEYETLEECVEKYLDPSFYGSFFTPEVVIARMSEKAKAELQDCKYVLEIYDDYRE